MEDINSLANAIEQSLRDTFKRADLEGSDLARKTTVEATLKNGDASISVSAPSYWIFADEGRKAGQRPPIKAILSWIKEKNLSLPSGVTQEGLAYAIANSIGRKGTKGKHFAVRLKAELKELVIEFGKAKVRQIIKDTFNKNNR